MKSKPDSITRIIDDPLFLVPIGAGAFPGIARSNRTAVYIVDAMCAKFDAPKDTVAAYGRKMPDALEA